MGNRREAKSQATFLSDVVCFVYNAHVQISNDFSEKRRKTLILTSKVLFLKFLRFFDELILEKCMKKLISYIAHTSANKFRINCLLNE